MGTQGSIGLFEAESRSFFRLGLLPGFLTGFARALDLGGTFDSYNISRSPADADIESLMADVKALKRDYLKAMNESATK